MTFQQNDNTGSLFKNTEQKSDRSPLYTGSCMIDGKRYRISAWVNEAKDGSKYFKLNFALHALKSDDAPF
jgi:hypothetical protein